jgi:putative copper export protein
MEPVEVTTYALHSVFAGVWTGAVVFVTLTILPIAKEGNLNASPLGHVVSRLTTVSRASALILFLTGSHMAAARYTGESLTSTDGGYLVLFMILLWLLLAATVEIGASRLQDGTAKDKVREPARNTWYIFVTASVFASLLLVTAGLLSANHVGFL